MKRARDVAPAPPRVPAARVDFDPEDGAWIADRIREVLASGQLTLGRYGAEFETAFAAFSGAAHAVAVSSGTAALEVILRGLGVAGRDVLVPANTFFATAAAVVHAGARPVFMETDPETLGTAPEEIERRRTPNTVGALVVHIGGLVSPRMPELVEACRSRGLWLVEDAAHAHGSTLDGAGAGTFGVASAFSFYPTKVMTSAEGGMILTGDAGLAEQARIYRDQGKGSFEQNAHSHLGYAWRLSEPHAIIGLRHLRRLPAMVEARRRIAAIYDRELRGIPGIESLSIPARCRSNYYKYVTVLAEPIDRPAFKAKLRENHGVQLAGEVYETPLTRQPVFAPWAGERLPVAEDVCARHLCLPVYASMTDAQAQWVVEALRTSLGR